MMNEWALQANVTKGQKRNIRQTTESLADNQPPAKYSLGVQFNVS